MKRASLRSALFTGLTLALLSGCTSMRSAPNDPLDAGEWRSAKSRMYQDLAMQCLRAQDHDRARSLLQQAVQFDPKDRRTLELLARLAYVRGDHDTAATAARQLLQLDPASVPALCTLGAIAEASQRPADAEAHYRNALAANAKDPRASIDLHRLLLLLGRVDEAATLRTTLAHDFPTTIETTIDHGASLAADGRWGDAATAYQHALTQAPDDPGAAAGFALASVLADVPEQALALGSRLPPRSRADNPSLALALATAHLRRSEHAAALRELDLALPTARAASALRLLRAEVLVRMGQADLANAEFERALVDNPDEVRAHAGLGRLHLAAGQPHAAVRCFENALRWQPTDAVNQALLAAALAASGDFERARRHTALANSTAGGKALVAELERRHPELRQSPEQERR